MTKAHYFEVAAFPIAGPNVYKALVTKYVLIVIYSAGTAVLGMPAITEVAGDWYGTLFPIGLFITSMMALAGVVRSRHTGHTRVEYIGTLLLLAGFLGYTAAIIYRAMTGHADIGTLPSALLPIILSVYPGFRLINILKEAQPAALINSRQQTEAEDVR